MPVGRLFENPRVIFTVRIEHSLGCVYPEPVLECQMLHLIFQRRRRTTLVRLHENLISHDLPDDFIKERFKAARALSLRIPTMRSECAK